MWPSYDAPPTSGALRQGEILSGLWDHRLVAPTTRLSNILADFDRRSTAHPLMIVLTQDCDLEQDYTARFNPDDPERKKGVVEEAHSKLLPHLLSIDLLTEQELRSRVPGGDVLRRAKQNQDERYHSLVPMFLDFKKVLGLPTESIYAAINAGSVQRVALVRAIYLHHVIHRFFAYQSRVALPD